MDYFADSESSDLNEMGHHHHPSPKRMNRAALKATKSRHVTVRSPSEEGLLERNSDTCYQRTSTPYASVRQSSSDVAEDLERSKAHKQSEQQRPVAENATAPPRISPYNAPAGTTVQNGTNQVYLHSQPLNNNQPYLYAVNYPGQSAPILLTNPATMDDYQNSAPNNGGLHFQPQVPDTSLGPMIHNYRPNFDGGVYYAQPGIAVCQPSPPSHFVPRSQYIHYLTPFHQPIRPITFIQAPLVAMPLVAPAVTVCPPHCRKCPSLYNTGLHGGRPKGCTARIHCCETRLNPRALFFSSFFFSLFFCSQTRYLQRNLANIFLFYRHPKV